MGFRRVPRGSTWFSQVQFYGVVRGSAGCSRNVEPNLLEPNLPNLGELNL
jgi:hypothetical protein